MTYEKHISAFGIVGTLISVVPFGSGHINDTLCVTIEQDGVEKQYVLQKMNTDIFKDPVGLMNNVTKVTDYMREQIVKCGGDPKRETLHFYPTVDGNLFYTDKEGACWRLVFVLI